MASLIAVEPSWVAGTLVKEPLKMPHGVRTAETMYASSICFVFLGLEAKVRRAWERSCWRGDAKADLQVEPTGRRRETEAMTAKGRVAYKQKDRLTG